MKTAGDRLPPWIKVRQSHNERFNKTLSILKEQNLYTVCEGANCPNLGACFASGTATFMILGDKCTRNCRFCAVSNGKVQSPDPDEPRRVAEAICQMKLDYAVITSVTRDDLTDGGANLFAEVIREIRAYSRKTLVEVLTPDFKGNLRAIKKVAEASPDVFNHNIETVPRLYPRVRPEADYSRSLMVLKEINRFNPLSKVKSGLMVGLGEKFEEIKEVLTDLRAVGCDFITIGQYLSPSGQHLQVEEYITPEQFEEYQNLAYGLGFTGVACGPLVRSSFQAKQLFFGDSQKKQ